MQNIQKRYGRRFAPPAFLCYNDALNLCCTDTFVSESWIGKGIGYMAVKIYESAGPADTAGLGMEIGHMVKAGTVICLNGDLGAGKTVFAQGLAKGLGISEPVNSPTFTILQVYEEGRLPLYHFDVYRIADPEEMDEIGYEEYFYGNGICLIEWSELIEELIPADAWQVKIEKDLDKGFDYRRITVKDGET